MYATRWTSPGGFESREGRTAHSQSPTDPPAPKGEVSTHQALDGLAGVAEQLTGTVTRPLDVVLLTRERIQETLEEAAKRGRLTRSDANELVTELLNRGRQQTEDLLGEVERLLERGRGGLESATKRARRSESVDRLMRGADRARRTVGTGTAFPIIGYDDLTAGQVKERLEGLRPADLRRIRVFEQRHANRKSVLDAVDNALAS
jgi:polyhydroxyalkanoate synthesis regulator phasin